MNTLLLLLACTGGSDDNSEDSGSTDTDTPVVAEPCPEGGGFENFIHRDGDQLFDGEVPFRFVSFNVPNLHMLEDPDWHVPDPWEQEDAIQSLVQLGGTVARTYTLSVGESNQETPRHVTAPGVFTEELFVALDHAVAKAREHCVRLIIPFVDEWTYWGGIGEYASFRGLEGDDFWTDDQVREDYWDTVEFLLTRINTVTGVEYRDDPTILAWETGNELFAPSEWTADIASRIKALDPDHLLLDGQYGIDTASLTDDNIDIVSNHYYWPAGYDWDYQAAAQDDHLIAQGLKPFLIGEFGFVDPTNIGLMLDVVIDDGLAGALIWSLRYHAVDGGFYWHTERDDDEALIRAYHWPGFASGEEYYETEILQLMREKAFAIRGLELPDIEAPQAPTLLSYTDTPELVWRGSTGAGWYSLERSETLDGPWEEIQTDLDDALEANTAEVTDETVAAGDTWYYRMRAHNEGGESEPSEPVGPVGISQSPELVFTDELDNFDLLDSASDGIFLDDTNQNFFDGDASRAARQTATEESIVYALDNLLWMSVEVYFWPSQEIEALQFEISSDGMSFQDLEVTATDEGGDWSRFVYTAEGLPEGTSHLRINWNNTEGKAWTPQVSRVELGYRD